MGACSVVRYRQRASAQGIRRQVLTFYSLWGIETESGRGGSRFCQVRKTRLFVHSGKKASPCTPMAPEHKDGKWTDGVAPYDLILKVRSHTRQPKATPHTPFLAGHEDELMSRIAFVPTQHSISFHR